MKNSTEFVSLLLEIEQVSREEDRMVHQLTVRASGHDPVILVDIESDVFEWPRIHGYHIDVLDVPSRLRDAFVFKVFEIMAGTICDYGGDRGHFPLSDSARWIETQFLTAEAELLLVAFSNRVK